MKIILSLLLLNSLSLFAETSTSLESEKLREESIRGSQSGKVISSDNFPEKIIFKASKSYIDDTAYSDIKYIFYNDKNERIEITCDEYGENKMTLSLYLQKSEFLNIYSSKKISSVSSCSEALDKQVSLLESKKSITFELSNLEIVKREDHPDKSDGNYKEISMDNNAEDIPYEPSCLNKLNPNMTFIIKDNGTVYSYQEFNEQMKQVKDGTVFFEYDYVELDGSRNTKEMIDQAKKIIENRRQDHKKGIFGKFYLNDFPSINRIGNIAKKSDDCLRLIKNQSNIKIKLKNILKSTHELTDSSSVSFDGARRSKEVIDGSKPNPAAGATGVLGK